MTNMRKFMFCGRHVLRKEKEIIIKRENKPHKYAESRRHPCEMPERKALKLVDYCQL